MADAEPPPAIPVSDPDMLRILRAKGQALYNEFSRNPVGKHTPDLQFILLLFRGSPVAGKYALRVVKPHRTWVLARLTGVRGEPPRLELDQQFTDLEEAERFVYRLRWLHLTGEALDP